MGCSCRWRSHSPFDRTRILLLQEQMMTSFKSASFWYHTIEKSFWSQASVVWFGTITTRSWWNTTCGCLLHKHKQWQLTEFIFYMVELAGFLKVLLQSKKVKTEMSHVLSERDDLLLAVFDNILRKRLSRIQFIFVTDWSIAADDGLLCPTMGVKTTLLMTLFRDVSVQQFDNRWNYRSQNTVWLQVTIGQQNPERKNSTTYVLRMRGETERQDVRHQWQRDHQDPEHLPHSEHEPQHVNDARVIPCAHSPVVRFWSAWFAHHIVTQVWVVRVSHVMHAVSVTLRLWAPNSIQLPLLFIHHLQSPVVFFALFPQPWGQ